MPCYGYKRECQDFAKITEITRILEENSIAETTANRLRQNNIVWPEYVLEHTLAIRKRLWAKMR